VCVVLSLSKSAQFFLRFLSFTCVRVFLHRFFPILSTSSNTGLIVQQTERKKKKRRNIWRRAMCAPSRQYISSHSLYLSLFLSSNTINIMMTFVPINELYTFAHTTRFESIHFNLLPIYQRISNINQYSSFTSQAKKEKSFDILNKY
jgi:hypothetical protein